jgi:hypothetical protein
MQNERGFNKYSIPLHLMLEIRGSIRSVTEFLQQIQRLL